MWMYKCTHIHERTCTHLCPMTVMDCALQKAAAVTLNISWTSFHFQFLFFYYSGMFSTLSPKKGFIFVSLLPENSWAKAVQTEKWKGREKKVIIEEKKRLWRICRRGDWWKTSSEGETAAVAVSEPHFFTLSFLLCTPSRGVAVLCKVYSWKQRHRTPEETNTKSRLVVMSGKGGNGL